MSLENNLKHEKSYFSPIFTWMMKKASQNDVAQIFAFPLIEEQSIKVEKEKLTIIKIILNLSDDKKN